MSVQRKRYNSEEKTKVAVEAIKGQKTINELAAEYGVQQWPGIAVYQQRVCESAESFGYSH